MWYSAVLAVSATAFWRPWVVEPSRKHSIDGEQMVSSTRRLFNRWSGGHFHCHLIIAALFMMWHANAGSITLTCPTDFVSCADISYLVQAPRNVTFSFTPTTTPGTNWGVLTETGIFTGGEARYINFDELVPYVGLVNNVGFRVTLVQNLTNNSSVAWPGITEVLVDHSPGLENAADPGFAHFHADADFAFDAFTPIGTFDSTANLTAGGGTVASRAALNAVGIGVHEWSIPGTRRSFDLDITFDAASVPEPATVVIGSVGLVLLAAARCVRKTF
jgi:hypothetical protein